MNVSKEAVIDLLEPRTKQYFEKFKQCADCGKIYWKGSHYERMLGFINWAQEASNDRSGGSPQHL